MIFRISLFLIISYFAISCTSQNTADVIIADTNIIDVETGKIAEDQTIEIRDGRIAKIHSSAYETDSKNIIDGSEKYVIPGLWDMHVHFRGGDSLISENKGLLDLFIANGVTTVRDAGGDITPAILEWKKQIENGEILGPKIFTSGPKLDGSDPSWAGSIELTSVDQVPAAFDSLESLNVDYVKLYDSTIPANVYLAAIKEAEERRLSVSGHMPFTVDFNDAVEAGLDATEHMYYVLKGASSEEGKITEAVRQGDYGFWAALSEVVETYNEETAQKTFVQMDEYGTAVVPTLHIGKVLAQLNEEDHSEDEYLKYIGEGIQETYQGRLQAAKSQSEEATQRRHNLRKLFVKMIPDIHNAGVDILAGSDSGPYNSFVYPGKSLHKELQELVSAGLSPLQALQTSVINGPDFFNVGDQYGKVKKGYSADLLLLNSNPLDSIENTEDIYTVVVAGKPISDDEISNSLLNYIHQK